MKKNVDIICGSHDIFLKNIVSFDVTESLFDETFESVLKKYNYKPYNYNDYSAESINKLKALADTNNIGWCSEQVSDSDGNFENNISWELNFDTSDTVISMNDLIIVFDKFNYIQPNSITVSWYYNDTNISTVTKKLNSYYCIVENTVSNFNKITIEFNSINKPNSHLKIYSIDFGKGLTIPQDNIKSFYVSLTSNNDVLKQDTIETNVNVYIDDNILNILNTSLFEVYINSELEYTMQLNEYEFLGGIAYSFILVDLVTYLSDIDYVPTVAKYIENDTYIGGDEDNINHWYGFWQDSAYDIYIDILSQTGLLCNIDETIKDIKVDAFFADTPPTDGYSTNLITILSNLLLATNCVLERNTLGGATILRQQYVETIKKIPTERILQKDTVLNKTAESKKLSVPYYMMTHKKPTTLKRSAQVIPYIDDYYTDGKVYTVYTKQPMENYFLLHSLSGNNVEKLSGSEMNTYMDVLDFDRTFIKFYAKSVPSSGMFLCGDAFAYQTSPIIAEKISGSSIGKAYTINENPFIVEENVNEILDKYYEKKRKSTECTLQVVVGEDVQRTIGRVKYGQKKYGTFKYGQRIVNESSTPHEDIFLGDLVETVTEDYGRLSGRVTKVSYYIDGSNTTIKEIVIE